MWKFKSSYKYGAISLHDCKITNIIKHGSNIELHFEDGFWLSCENSQNPYKKTLRTGESCLILINANCEDVIFNGIRFSWDEFCENINSKQWNFECITECYREGKSVYAGWIWTEKGVYRPNPDCHLWFTFEEMIYNWNDIREDRVW